MVLCLYGYSAALMAFGVGSKYILKHTIHESKSNVVNMHYCVILACCFVIIQWLHAYHVSKCTCRCVVIQFKWCID